MSAQATIEHGRYLETLRGEAELLADTAAGARHEARVPSCPGLALGEAVRHVGSVYRVVRAWLADGRRPEQWQRDPRDGQSVEDYLRAGLAELLPELDVADPGAPVDTWWPADRTVGFWQRRMAHETTIHRVDVQSAAGVPVREIPEDVALDGIDEVLHVWFGHRLGQLGVTGTREGTVGLHAGDRAWWVRADPTQSTVRRVDTRDAANVDARVHGSAELIYLWLWGRTPTTEVTTEGDVDAVAQLWALLRLATR
ncbi:maleylpyruvate isomerase family mycothiol-dependent enzyme [Haloechinothrix sp. YIM 98757]|uniref:Maleylpyruvate isomerase family mycothiol-dependent enzyme n=1 Tax=Haloechinothrix aidingensis TaxID=2752311 RepID=A0A837ZZJ1_9PSEU|nr:maleylpyruvate isomerase family mycothiol-dependent enzyme [Haloechinothrix aidingensis]MBA0125664.1 maleylpyruvate isomerase family mycothiol-dependent enzyme [Haloechinothrix aidingensis]